MAYGLTRVNKDGIQRGLGWSRSGVQLTLISGATIEHPDWDPSPLSMKGIPLLPNACGDWSYLLGHHWVVLEYDEKDLVVLDDGVSKVPRGKIMEVQDPDSHYYTPSRLLSYFDISKFSSSDALYWAVEIGNRDVMINRITESPWALEWALNIGDHDIMINRVTDLADIMDWVDGIGDIDIMKSKITDPQWISEWNDFYPDDPIETG